MTTPTTLYRLFGAGGELLYIGIAGNPGRRWEQHAGEKPWWGEVVGTTLEHFPTREAAAAAEAAAIAAERPRHNVVHNRGASRQSRRMCKSCGYLQPIDKPHDCMSASGHAPAVAADCPTCGPLKSWHWSNREWMGDWSGDLYLTFEVTGDPVTDEVYPSQDPMDHVERWAAWLEEHTPEALEQDRVRISWFVSSHTAGVFEEAPGPAESGWGDTFTTIFTIPHDDRGMPIDWRRLPVHTRWPLLYQGLLWTPFPLQPWAPVRTLLDRVGVY